MLSANEIVALQDRLTRNWHAAPDSSPLPDSAQANAVEHTPDQALWSTIRTHARRLHRANFDLWHIEDEARMPGAANSQIAAVKRRIDTTNQLRNDLIEQLDRALLEWLSKRGQPNPEAPLHSEPPGMIVDRLSILSLKIYHTREELDRSDAPLGHEARNRERLAILEEQRGDLASCLDALWQQTLRGERRFKLYRQLKMYNDPSLNPAIYGKTASIKIR